MKKELVSEKDCKVIYELLESFDCLQFFNNCNELMIALESIIEGIYEDNEEVENWKEIDDIYRKMFDDEYCNEVMNYINNHN